MKDPQWFLGNDLDDDEEEYDGIDIPDADDDGWAE